MLNISDTLLAIDHDKSVALYLSAEDRPFLLHRHTTPGRCFLPAPCLGYALRTLHQKGANDVTLHLELRPSIPGLSYNLPFMAFVGMRDRIVLGYLPGKLGEKEAELVFDTFPGLPVLISDAEEFFVCNRTYVRLMGDPTLN
jgi:hypothetical protein